ncbi:conserved hypothetical protein [Ricinus communis]|uniref:Uncharacterized protein n=1 Tax=Ricinus communis TaxID=3988 RepID=B9RPZ9_RICCO|nr:conserved hypothetical protein [Ricinus communis]
MEEQTGNTAADQEKPLSWKLKLDNFRILNPHTSHLHHHHRHGRFSFLGGAGVSKSEPNLKN